MLIGSFTITRAEAATVRNFTVPSTINSRCTVPVTTQLNSWLEGIPDGTPRAPVTVNFGGRSNCFLLDDIPTPTTKSVDGVQMVQKKHWRVQGATLIFRSKVPTRPNKVGQQQAVNRSELAIIDSEDIKASNFTLTGNRSSTRYNGLLEYDHNATVIGGTNITLSGFTMSEADGDNIEIKHGSEAPTDVSLISSTLKNANRNNLSITDGNRISVVNNKISGGGHWAIDAELHDDRWSIENLRVAGNSNVGGVYGFINIASRIGASTGVANVEVTRNIMATPVTAFEFALINLSPSAAGPTRNVTISLNTFTVRQYGVSAQGVDGLSVTGNRVTTQYPGSATDCGGRLALVAGSNGLSRLSIVSNTYRSAAPADYWCQKTTTTRPVQQLAISRNTGR